jgi:DNA mismatch repair protein MutS
VIEDLRSRAGCRTLFATHYLQLADLARLPGIANAQVLVRQHRDEIVFLHQVVPGAADKSWGVHVAKLAGVPAAVIERAGQLLAGFEGAAAPAVFDTDFAAEPPEELHVAPGEEGGAADSPLDAAAPREPALERPPRRAPKPRPKPAPAEQRSLFE